MFHCAQSTCRLVIVALLLCSAAEAADSDGNLVADPTISEPVALPTTVTSPGAAVELYDFDIVDQGTSDGLDLTVSQIIANTSGTASAAEFAKVTWRLDGPDASDVTGAYSSNTITFSGLAITVTDNSSERYVIKGHYSPNTGLTENHTFILSIDGDTDLTVGVGGTQMGATTAVANSTGTTIQVNATQLVFTTDPADSGVQDGSDEVISGIVFETQPVVAAQDAGGNDDVDFNENITLTLTSAPGSLSGTATKGAVSGVADFSGLGLTYSATGDGDAFTHGGRRCPGRPGSHCGLDLWHER